MELLSPINSDTYPVDSVPSINSLYTFVTCEFDKIDIVIVNS